MGDNLFNSGKGEQYLYLEKVDVPKKYVVFSGHTTSPPPPISGVTGDRLGVVYFGQTTSLGDIKIYLSPLDDSGVKMTDPDSVVYHYSESDPYHTSSNNLPGGIYTSDWSGSTAGGIAQNGASCTVNSSDSGLTQQSHMMSCLTTSGSPTGTISSGEWIFNQRVRTSGLSGTNELKWYVYKSEIIDEGQTYDLYSNDTYLFSGTTGNLTTSYTDYEVKIIYPDDIVY